MAPKEKIDDHDIDEVNDSVNKQVHPNETEELVARSLEELEIKLGELSPDQRRFFDQALERAPALAKDPAFRLMFLRTEVFNVELAALRLAKYWENRVDLFGEEKAFLPTTMKALLEDNEKDMESLHCGYVKAVPGHSRLLFMDPSATPKKRDVDSVTRSIVYSIQRKLETSDDMQRKGAVFIVDFGKVRWFDRKLTARVAASFNDNFPLRTSLVCIVRPPPGFATFVNILKLFFKPKVRERFHVIHKDEKLKNMTGVVVEDLLKIDHESWIQHMKQLEENGAHM